MTKPVTRKLAVDCLLHRIWLQTGVFLICPECGEPIKPEQDVEFDHIHADVFDGEHHYTNLRPLHKDCHRKRKTPRDVRANAKVKRIAAGAKKRKGNPIPSRPFSRQHRPMNPRKAHGKEQT